MSRLVMWNLITLDGFFEGAEQWDLDWHEAAWCDELKHFSGELLRSADRLVFGRATYDGMAAHWPSARGETAELMNSLPKVVFSRTLGGAEWENTTVARDPLVEIPKLKEQGARNTLVLGSGTLCETLIRSGLFDEYRLCVAPVVIGRGTPLFGRSLDRQDLPLLEARQLTSGGVLLHFAAPVGR